MQTTNAEKFRQKGLLFQKIFKFLFGKYDKIANSVKPFLKLKNFTLNLGKFI